MTQKIKIKEIKTTHKAGADRFNPSNRIYVRAAYGFYQKLRKFTGWGLILFFIGLPLIQWNGHQAVLFDVDKQQFHLFNMTLFPQDLTLLAWTFIIAAFALFFFTTYLGRVWCGYTCPQTVWTFIFIWFEERFEGAANKRKRLDQMPWDFNKIWRKTAKHISWLIVSLLTALAFCSYFVPVKTLYSDFFTGQSSAIVLIMIFIFAISTYANAGWMRSIFCIHMCPYSRFQSAMFDKNTYSVGYDATRGEARGPRSRKTDRAETGLGDCVDCDLCVQVCPSGIDIRDGLQYECINCGACVDACDETMDKMGYPRGLISYTSEQVLEGKETKLMRPKIIGYGLMLLIMGSLFVVNLATLSKAEMEIVRDRGALYRENVDGLIENTYTLKVLNKTIQTQVYRITFTGLKDATLNGPKEISIRSGEVFTQPISIAVDPYDIKSKKVILTIKLTNVEDGEVIEQESPFFLNF
ncbi:cytochrome c oxidase accessory protein CcoG [Psychromonas sp. RZ22]|uniref:cytochrome c oxidase accessory protein CcoG n=1 Tax=Psychromonas algarum TaxID=2555643 RepID=UPI0010675CA4|nr:cytochrome c oxidase accessory protein CcoG [Psychromonas sp. RZ22]TEW54118.1 cytochrome c oxidase accessory protein CcoG [Psychromonas sp. RZ22]